MSRSINKVQSDILLDRMQSNKEIACGFVKQSKDVVAEFWSSLTEELNSVGPPIKSDFEWKKVWVDQKRYVRSKAAANFKTQNATGGGPNLTKRLSATEEVIYELIGMKESVEGLETSLRFGLRKNDPPTQTVEIAEVLWEEPTFSKAVTPPPLDTTINAEPMQKAGCSQKRKRVEPQEKINTAELIGKELKSQEALCSKISEIVGSLENHNVEVQGMMKRMYRALEKSNDIKSKQLKELERHHAVLEELRAKEVEAKIEKIQKVMEIEELKLKLFQKKN